MASTSISSGNVGVIYSLNVVVNLMNVKNFDAPEREASLNPSISLGPVSVPRPVAQRPRMAIGQNRTFCLKYDVERKDQD